MNWDWSLALLVCAVFLLAGTVKGVVGLGLPVVSLAILTATVGLTNAMAIMIVPAFVTNVWQALAGSHARATFVRIWPFLAAAGAMVWTGTLVLKRVDVALLSGFLGFLIILYAALNLSGVKFVLSNGRERWAGPLLGAINGAITGMTGAFVMPGVPFLQSIGLPRGALIQAMGMLFTVSAFALALSLGKGGLFSPELGLLSAAAVIPSILGMALGQRIRDRLSETLFRRIFFVGLLVVGATIVAKALP